MNAKNLSKRGQQLKGERLKGVVKVLEHLLDRSKYEALQFAKDLKKIKTLTCFHVIGTFWDCPKSPFGLCAYDSYEDRAHDNCLFCHAPEERK